MSVIGFYRYKVKPNTNQDVNLYINGILSGTKTIEIKDFCEGSKRIKFLNKDGQYRFVVFNKYYEINDKPKEIGKVNNIITSLLSSQTAEKSVGYKNERKLDLVSESISQDELNVFKDLWTSPRVYLYIGDGLTDEISDWVEVTIQTKNPITKIPKGSYTDIKLSAILPKHYSVNML